MLPFRLDEMLVEDKLQAMEILWNDLCQNEQDIPSPPWHGELLQGRAAALARGEDWEAAKRRIRGENISSGESHRNPVLHHMTIHIES